MNLFLTKKIIDKIKVELKPEMQTDELFSWRANYIQEHGCKFVVIMNDATRFVIVINEAKIARLRNITNIFFENLRATLLALCINPDVVSKYISDLGEISFVKNSDRKKTAWLNNSSDDTWFALGNLTDDVSLSVAASKCWHAVKDNKGEHYISATERMIKRLEVYGLPTIKFKAYDLVCRLELESKDAIRKLRVPSTISFDDLHKVLQKAFEWQNYHLHSFGMFKAWSENYYARPDVELLMDEESLAYFPGAVHESGKRLNDYVPEYMNILYRYDFGDDWHHFIEVVDTIEDCEEKLPKLLSGDGDSPPEDVGGQGGYSDFLEVISDTTHEDYDYLKTWSESQKWKPFDFDAIANTINRE